MYININIYIFIIYIYTTHTRTYIWCTMVFWSNVSSFISLWGTFQMNALTWGHDRKGKNCRSSLHVEDFLLFLLFLLKAARSLFTCQVFLPWFPTGSQVITTAGNIHHLSSTATQQQQTPLDLGFSWWLSAHKMTYQTRLRFIVQFKHSLM